MTKPIARGLGLPTVLLDLTYGVPRRYSSRQLSEPRELLFSIAIISERSVVWPCFLAPVRPAEACAPLLDTLADFRGRG